MTICIHAAYDCLRKRRRHAGREIPDERLERHPAYQPSADEMLDACQTREMIYGAIRLLPQKQRTTVTMRLLAELSYDAIAQALGCSETTARTHFMRALVKLRDHLKSLRPGTGKEVQP